MMLRDPQFLEEIMPKEEWCDLRESVLELDRAEGNAIAKFCSIRLAYLDFEEANEKVTAAKAAVDLKKIQYGVGP
ncbi:hypothetical protein [Roseovarius indicus]|uniref:hypothetical protein n=1 Tax=Roseovarius indicus TaxID=540747 RepID=UPI0032ED93AC